MQASTTHQVVEAFAVGDIHPRSGAVAPMQRRRRRFGRLSWLEGGAQQVFDGPREGLALASRELLDPQIHRLIEVDRRPMHIGIMIR